LDRDELPDVPLLCAEEADRACAPWGLLAEDKQAVLLTGIEVAIELQPLSASAPVRYALSARIQSRLAKEAYVLHARRYLAGGAAIHPRQQQVVEDLAAFARPYLNRLITSTDHLRADWLWRIVGEEGHVAVVEALHDAGDGAAQSVELPAVAVRSRSRGTWTGRRQRWPSVSPVPVSRNMFGPPNRTTDPTPFIWRRSGRRWPCAVSTAGRWWGPAVCR
jgi:hypothetical protein